MDNQMGRGLTPQSHFRAIHTEDPRVSERRTASGVDLGAGLEAEFHEPAGVVFGKVDAVEQSFFAVPKPVQSQDRLPASWPFTRRSILDTELQFAFSMKRPLSRCQEPVLAMGTLCSA